MNRRRPRIRETTSLAALVNTMPERSKRLAFVQWTGYRRESRSYLQVYEQALRFRTFLREIHMKRGDRVVLQGPNGPQWVSLFLGGLAHGAVIVPIDEHSSASFVGAVCARAEPRLIIAPDQILSSGWAVPCLSWEEVDRRLGQCAPSQDWVEIGSDERVEIIFTSGTTGMPRGVLITQRNLLANLGPIETVYRRWERWVRLWGPLRFASVLPLSHLFGQVTGIFVTLLMGATTVFIPPVSGATMASILAEEGITAMFAVPRVMRLLEEHVDQEGTRRYGRERWRQRLEQMAPRSPWRRIWAFRHVHGHLGWRFWAFVVGGASVEPDRIEFWRRLGYAVMQGYGLTEAGPIVTVNNPFGPSLYSAGRPMPGLEVKLAPDGEILVRGPNVTPGYLSDESRTAEILEGGWLRTGDIGEWDEAGHLHIRGRKKEVIVTEEGFNVFPEDVEAELRRHPAVKDAVVLGRSRGGRVIIHAVVLCRETEADLSQILAETNERLEPHQKIQNIQAWDQPDFPRTPTQKVRRTAVAAALDGGGPVPEEPEGQDRLGALLDQLVKARGEKLADDARLQDDLGLSSLDRVELAQRLEEDFQMEISDVLLRPEATVADVRRVLGTPQEGIADLPFPWWPRSRPARAIRAVAVHAIGLPVLHTLGRVAIRGRDHLAACSPPALLVANHTSPLDTLAILVALPAKWRGRVAPAMTTRLAEAYLHPDRSTRWATLRNAAWVNLLFLFGNMYFLASGTAFRATLRHTGRLLDEGYCPLIFPEGTMTRTGTMGVFQPGIGVVVREMRVPVIPVALQGLYEICPPEARWPRRRGPIRILIGQQQRLHDHPKEVITACLEQAIRELLQGEALTSVKSGPSKSA